MGLALYPVFESDETDLASTFGGGKMIAQAADQLDELALVAGVASLTAFISISDDDVADMFGDDAAAGALPAVWFDSGEGLKTTRAIIECLNASPAIVPHGDDVLEDLQELESVLSKAVQQGKRFRLAMDV